jgi:FkbM family methyltransferase
METPREHDPYYELFCRTKNCTQVTFRGQELQFLDMVNSTTVPATLDELKGDLDRIASAEFKPGDVILDLGANVGVVSILMAKLFPQTRIIAIEPIAHNYDNLVLNVRAAKIQTIECVRTAVSGKSGKLVLRQDPANSGSGSIHHQGMGFPQFAVDAVTLDELFARHKIDRCAYLKMDIEGSEYEVVEGSSVWSRCDRVNVEIHYDHALTREKNLEKRDRLVSTLKRFLRDDQLSVRMFT